MTARAVAVEQTGDRILDAALVLWAEVPFDQLRLETIAERAAVTVPTVVRRFGGKAGVVVSLVERELGRLIDQREAHSGDPTTVVIADLVRFYERFGALILKMYGEAPLVDGLAEVAARARRQHLAWCRETFASRLPALDQADADRRLAQLVAVCDATTWWILRADCGLDAGATLTALTELVGHLLPPDTAPAVVARVTGPMP